MSQSQSPSASDDSSVTAVLIVLVIVLIVAVCVYGRSAKEHHVNYAPSFIPPGNPKRPQRSRKEGMTIAGDSMVYNDTPETRSVYGALNRMYSTADTDPLITGQLYHYSDGVRNVYAQRSSHGDGLNEYSSDGGPGDVGVDVGPYGLAEYGGKEVGFDDGIPEQWRMPSTPIRWYAPKQRDHYGPEGPTVYAEGLYQIQQPDHDPLLN